MKNNHDRDREQPIDFRRCHQCGSEHDVGEINLRNGAYSFRSVLCKKHQDEIVKHFDALTSSRANAAGVA